MFISINQAINFWDQLVQCYHCCNGYGTDTAEIYIFTMIEHSPLFANNPGAPMATSECLKACRAMFDLCKKFESDYDCMVLFADGSSLDLLTSIPFDHRIHLKVIHNN